MGNDIIAMFLLNSIWETYGMILFFKRDQAIQFKTIKLYYLLFFVSFINAMLYAILPPLIFQIVYILFIILVFRYINNIPVINCIKSIFKFIAFIAVFEGIITIVVLQFGIDLRDINYGINLLLYCLPIKIMEIFIIYHLKK